MMDGMMGWGWIVMLLCAVLLASLTALVVLGVARLSRSR
jgi:ABC-type multidrug transport system permease subunit